MKPIVLAFNGCYFHNKKDSSWVFPEPCSGSYKVNKRTVVLYNIAGQKIGVIANNVMCRATRLEDGKWFYTYTTPKGIPEYEKSQWAQEREEVAVAMGLLQQSRKV